MVRDGRIAIIPDGSIFDSWIHIFPDPYLPASFWYWFVTLPMDAPEATWRFIVDYDGEQYQHAFEVATPLFADGFETGDSSSWTTSG